MAKFFAAAVVLCVGGIESCRLLLQTAAQDPAAPWRDNRWVGHGFHDHISAMVATISDCTLAPVSGYFDYSAYRGHRYHPKMVLAPAAQQRLGTLDVCGTVMATTNGTDDMARAFATLRLLRTGRGKLASADDLIHFARHLPQLLWQKLPLSRSASSASWEGRSLRLCLHCEQSIDSGGAIKLSDRCDALGQRQAKVSWRAGAVELHTIRSYLSALTSVFEKNGLGRIIPDPGVMDDDDSLCGVFREGSHHMGGARMAASADAGVVNPDLRIFGTTNAYICSSAVFPSAGFVNPTHTIIALAARLADHLSADA